MHKYIYYASELVLKLDFHPQDWPSSMRELSVHHGKTNLVACIWGSLFIVYAHHDFRAAMWYRGAVFRRSWRHLLLPWVCRHDKSPASVSRRDFSTRLISVWGEYALHRRHQPNMRYVTTVVWVTWGWCVCVVWCVWFEYPCHKWHYYLFLKCIGKCSLFKYILCPSTCMLKYSVLIKEHMHNIFINRSLRTSLGLEDS